MSDNPKDAEPEQPISLEIWVEMRGGTTYEEAVATIAERTRIQEKTEGLLNKPIEEWPEFAMQWDEDPESFHHSLDGTKAADIDTNEIALVRVKLSNLDAVLQDWNLRTVDEVWSVGNPRRAARVIVHCSEGGKLSPVWVVPTTPGKVGLVGGNQRLAVARAKGTQELPIIFWKKELERLKPLFPELSTS